ncbi:RCC1 domain-containing protein [Catellatospora tritici]|uniref:RCC1 domain-containing protein n=1 Tax=Catellatospora tritici TaxID=2851566 RepID=UPI001C2CCDA5|nr:cell wall anchor protein [Catellatospora tritici]MBV1855683.1 cell wall anchor protein [Catellatospora tritici]
MRQLKTWRYGLGAAASLSAAAVTALLMAAPVAAAAGNNEPEHNNDKPAAALHGAESWGFNSAGQLGNGATDDRDTATTVHIPEQVLTVAAGDSHGLALLANHTVKAWGSNSSGQLGYGVSGKGGQAEPGTVAGLGNVKAIAGGGAHSLALLNNGTVMAWGLNNRGQLGDGTTTNRDRPVAVTGLGAAKVTAISAGGLFSLVLLADGTVRAFGDNSVGQLGIGSVDTDPHPTPVPVVLGGAKIKAIDAGPTHGLAVTAAGGVKGWGDNSSGQVGTGNQVTPQPTPVDVVGLGGVKVKAVSGGEGFSLALLTNGKVRGWGSNADGQLGDGTFVSPRLTPVEAVGLTGVTAISAGIGPGGMGLAHSLAIAAGTVKAWGRNSFGQLGTGGPTTTSINVPTTVRTGLSKPKSVAAGQNFSLAS